MLVKLNLSVLGLMLLFCFCFLIIFRLKRLWVMTPTTQMMKFPQWRGDRCLVAGQGREPSLLTMEKRVRLAASSYSQGRFLFNWPFLFFLIRIPYIVSCVFVFWLIVILGLDLAFKTPIRSIMRHERILSEMDPVSPCNSTARNIYSPIVRFLTPSKESECSYCYWRT